MGFHSGDECLSVDSFLGLSAIDVRNSLSVRHVTKIVAQETTEVAVQRVRLFPLYPKVVVGILACIVRKCEIRSTKASLSEITCLLPQRISFLVFTEAGGKCRVQIAKLVNSRISGFYKTVG